MTDNLMLEDNNVMMDLVVGGLQYVASHSVTKFPSYVKSQTNTISWGRGHYKSPGPPIDDKQTGQVNLESAPAYNGYYGLLHHL